MKRSLTNDQKDLEYQLHRICIERKTEEAKHILKAPKGKYCLKNTALAIKPNIGPIILK